MTKNMYTRLWFIAGLLLPALGLNAQYCTSFEQDDILDCSDGDGIVQFSLTGESTTAINYNSTACNAAAYWDLTTTSISLAAGATYSIQALSGYEENALTIWIDLNNNNTFEATEKVLTETAINEITPTTISLVMPATTALGARRMRVMSGFYDFTSAPPMDPCNDDGGGFNVLYYGRVHDFTATILAPLPVAMDHLKGTALNNVATLSWRTYSEVNNKGFEMQRSEDGRNFSVIGFVDSRAANGNSTEALEYTYTDNMYGTMYYRLRQVDIDGKSLFSNTVQVADSRTSASGNMTLVPNPARNNVQISYPFNIATEANLMITDFMGRVLIKKIVNSNTLSLDISDLPTGTYLVRYITGLKSETIKLVKQ